MKNRPIKFRAWDEDEKLMTVWDIILSDGFRKYLAADEVILMQYTGLKDKNGKMIFEGDICKNGDWENDAHAYNYRTEVVEWDADNGCWIGWNHNDDGMTCEVIGNIYENPDLLEK